MNRKLLYLILLLILWISISIPSYSTTKADPKVLHIINRLSFGPRPGDMENVEAIGIERYIKQQLTPESISEQPGLVNKLAQLETLRLTPVQLFQQYGRQQGEKPTPEAQKANRQRSRVIIEQAVTARLERATQSRRQLYEVMVDFWFNHFNVYAGKGLTRLWVGAYEQQAIRPFALGRFRDLLGATARHPAMLFYLDNWQNTAPGSAGARGRFKGINENYARELMELHTLGVDGGYTQEDVMNLAKIFTGWGFHRRSLRADNSDGFYFDPSRHDMSDKVFLGQSIKGSGITEGEQALDILAKSPKTARHISYKLAQYFIADKPPQALVERLSQRFLSTDGNIQAVLDTLFHSSEFWDSQYFHQKFKTPYEYIVSAIRATGIEINNFQPIYNSLQQLGMPLYGCQTPNGYQNTQDAWLNPDAMTRRLSFATALSNGRFGKPVDATKLALTLGNPFSDTTNKALSSSPRQLRAALILGSPEFMKR
jgi:uncharacterized protein (DUF1800 family)